MGDLNAAVLVHGDEMAAVYVYDGKIGLMDAGENIRLSERMLKAFLYQASHLNAARVFDEHEPWREYGLETPYATLILMGKDGTRQRIYIGDQAAYGEGRYVRAEGDERLYLLDGIGAEMMDYGPDDFRDIQIFPSLTTESLSKLTRITIEHGGNRLDIRGVQKDGAIPFYHGGTVSCRAELAGGYGKAGAADCRRSKGSLYFRRRHGTCGCFSAGRRLYP